jgi:hypothetical protein
LLTFAQEMEKDFQDEQETTFAVTADMARQYKALQEELIHKINALETTLTEQKEELDMTGMETSPQSGFLFFCYNFDKQDSCFPK